MIAVKRVRSVAPDMALDMLRTMVSRRLRPSAFMSWNLLLCLAVMLPQTGKCHPYVVTPRYTLGCVVFVCNMYR